MKLDPALDMLAYNHISYENGPSRYFHLVCLWPCGHHVVFSGWRLLLVSPLGEAHVEYEDREIGSDDPPVWGGGVACS